MALSLPFLVWTQALIHSFSPARVLSLPMLYGVLEELSTWSVASKAVSLA